MPFKSVNLNQLLSGSHPAQEFCDFLRIHYVFLQSISESAVNLSCVEQDWIGHNEEMPWDSPEVLYLSVQLNPKFTLGFYSTSEKNLAQFIGTSDVAGQPQLPFSSSARCCPIHEQNT